MPHLIDAARRAARYFREVQRNGERGQLKQSILDDLEAALRLYEPLEQPPTEPGWYWTVGGNDSKWRPVEVVDTEEGLQVTYDSKPSIMPWFIDEMNPERKWIGPIPEPTAQNDE